MKRGLELYAGENFDEVSSFFFFETLRVRSEQHDWKIQPHRHQHFYQIFVVTEGGGEIHLDDHISSLCAPGVVVIPDGVMHGFDWTVDSKGYVLCVSSAAIGEVCQHIGGNIALEPACISSMPFTIAESVAQVCDALEREDQKPGPFRESMLLATIQQLLIWILRAEPQDPQSGYVLKKSEHKLSEFKKLIVQHAGKQHQVNWYADKIGVSSAHLNQICQRYTGNTALALIHKYLLEEAKRYLIFADLRISAISDRLGFTESTYFSKFFKKTTGFTPAEYRKALR